MKSKILSLVFFCIVAVGFAQNVTVQGTVNEGTDMPLPGVSILIKGTSTGTATDFDGNFVLEDVPISSVLVFSYVGFQDYEVVIENDAPLTITLQEDAEALDEVVLIGYGTQAKKEITGAVSVVGSETIEKLNPVRVEQALQGQVSGVSITAQSGSPGSASNIRIRGVTTNGNNNPLILVDGNVIEDLSVINPNDIESMNVLKDATAGIYGVRAANGVILITTKSGAKSSPLRFELDTYAGVQETSRKIPVLNATEYGVIVNEAFAAGGSTPPFLDFTELGEGTDWQDEIFQTAPIANVNFAVNKGWEDSKLSVGTSYLTQDGIVGGSDANFSRFTGRVNYNLDFFKNFKLNTSWIYTNTNRKNLLENTLGSVLFNALNMAPNLPVYDENGDYTLAEGLGNEVINPQAQIDNTHNKTYVDKISGAIGLNYSFLEHFSAESRFQFNYSEVSGKVFSPEVYYGSGKVFNVTRNLVNEYHNIYRDYTWDTFLTYKNSWAESHNLTALLGMSVRQESGKLSGLTGYDIPDNDPANASIENASDVEDNYRNGGDTFDTRLLSYFTRAQYDYKGKYLVSVVLRRDASTRFGPENRVGYFPSISTGWVVSDESFMENTSWMNFLKLRVSYGIVGNDRIPDYGYVSLLNGEGTYVLNDELIFGKAEGALANPEIRWEKQKTFDIGVDFKFLDNKFDVTMDYFNKRTDDLLLVPQVSGMLGASAPGSRPPIVNAGSVENKGFEFAVTYSDDVSDDFRWNISYNVTYLQNNVLSVAEENGFVTGGSFGVGQDPPARMEVGQPIGYFYGLKTDGLFQNQAEVDAHADQANAAPGDLRYVDQLTVDTNDDGIPDAADGVINEDDRVYIGDPIAPWTMGLNLGMNYRNWDFGAYFFASLGNEIVRNYERNQPLTNRSSYFLNRWTGEGSTDSFPRVTTGANSNGLFSDFYVEDGSYLRIQNLQLGYTFNSDEWKNVDKFRIYASVNNAYTFTKYTGYDPAASTGEPIGGGIDQGFYPIPRVYMLGLNLKF
ncbi:SusC/RagA family TonB-linked outer membrane protein [Lutimonas zeaxanthinifaciens]|uniref:SusC/RagA family TonB-linked outer membrane protein n=1 Tax=Lutimonas zeaxanthinifaciens TaxID=3060215 RepID=UPI00265CA255|nr:TonB-dependent receptor [Lutimonas sp. YSD2104]WKK65129.1 TonB-dependent receptor [Lutimonas sp. YSD2104]